MVATRHHPQPFPDPATPKATARSEATPSASSPQSDDSATISSTSRKRRAKRTTNSKTPTPSIHLYSHKVPPLLVIWLYVSLPLVIWDTGYIALRPHSMPGGKFHSPIWKLYALYGTVDYVYGWPAWNGHVGFTAAQASLNAVETAMYIYYFIAIYRNASGNLLATRSIQSFFLGEDENSVRGPGVAKAVLYLFSAAVMTFSKTVLYWLNEYFSGFANIGHNSAYNLVFLWIIPNGLWLVFPAYIMYLLGAEILEAMDGSSFAKED
ncbi:hypothetical protein CLCR_10635 [Cladophialophora carrionii]|uniref:C6 transcription factor n=1 Tax=Cladophialophora carrionii TaxID=86049 RepID=A0A1C1CZH2_9EURO|nr:hypothetical protein CLCR_10635 [Cladophialophora carrionii]